MNQTQHDALVFLKQREADAAAEGDIRTRDICRTNIRVIERIVDGKERVTLAVVRK
jgi:hypothetical protein